MQSFITLTSIIIKFFLYGKYSNIRIFQVSNNSKNRSNRPQSLCTSRSILTFQCIIIFPMHIYILEDYTVFNVMADIISPSLSSIEKTNIVYLPIIIFQGNFTCSNEKESLKISYYSSNRAWKDKSVQFKNTTFSSNIGH